MYQFILDKVKLPLAPQSLKMSIDDKDETVDLMNGEVLTILNSPGLTEFEFDFILPASPIGSTVPASTFHDPDYYLSKLESLKLSKKPFTFKVIRTIGTNDRVVRNLKETVMTVSIMDYDVTEDAENYGFGKKVNIRLREYHPHATKKITVEIEEGKGNIYYDETKEREIEYKQEVTQVISAGSWLIKEGDTLQSISQAVFGTTDYWAGIADLNNIEHTTEPLNNMVGRVISVDEEKVKELAANHDEKQVSEQKKGFWSNLKDAANKSPMAPFGNIITAIQRTWF